MPRTWKSARDIVNLRAGRNDWYRIKNLATGSEVSIYDEIGYLGVSAQDFIADLKNAADPVTLHLHTPGGEVFDGIAIYNALKSRPDVSVRIEGLAASIGSVIAMAASPGQLQIAKRARMMIHDGFSMAVGNAADMRALADQLDAESDNIAGIYADRTGKPQAYWRELMRAETWYDGQQAVDAGLADLVINADARPVNEFDLSVFRNSVTLTSPVIVNADGNHAPMTGTHTHSHPAYGAQGGDSVHSHEHEHQGDANHGHHRQAAGQDAGVSDHAGHCPACRASAPVTARFCGMCGSALFNADGDNGWVARDGEWVFDPDGDGDDDGTPEGDTDHDYFDEDGNQVKPIPPKPTRPATTAGFTGRVLNADVDNSPWDAAKAWHNGATADDPAAFYKGICAGRKAGPPENQSSWALPYKYHPGDAPNAAGVRNALSRLPQTDGLVNKAEAQALLERLMKQVNPDYEPDDLADPALLSAALLNALGGVNVR